MKSSEWMGLASSSAGLNGKIVQDTLDLAHRLYDAASVEYGMNKVPPEVIENADLMIASAQQAVAAMTTFCAVLAVHTARRDKVAEPAPEVEAGPAEPSIAERSSHRPASRS